MQLRFFKLKAYKETSGKKKKFFGVIAGLIFLISLQIYIFKPINNSRVLVNEYYFLSLNDFSFNEKQKVTLYPVFETPDLNNRIINYQILVEPNSFGLQLGNTFQAIRNFYIWNDSSISPGHEYLVNQGYGSFRGQSYLGIKRDISMYPFDEYYSEIAFWGYEFFPEDLSNKDDVPINFELNYLAGNYLENFQLGMARVPYDSSFLDSEDFAGIQKDLDEGYLDLAIFLVRDKISKVLATIVAIFMFSVPMLSYALYKKVRDQKRPPTLSALIWVNALIFTNLLSRNILPGDPPIGIYFDIFITLPSVIATGIFSLLMTKIWLSRNDHLYI